MAATNPSSRHTNSEQVGGSPTLRAIMGVAGRPFNTFVLRFAGSQYLRLYGVVYHQGRQSGRSYATPVVVRATADGFVIPLAFGERADWFRNLRAAGGCVIRWNGARHAVVDPVVIDWTTAQPAFSPIQRVLVARFGIERFVHVRRARAGDRASEAGASVPFLADAQEALAAGTASQPRRADPNTSPEAQVRSGRLEQQ
jgi:deazaflavin-dependent oxidoreductase (nitroreductase family)